MVSFSGVGTDDHLSDFNIFETSYHSHEQASILVNKKTEKDISLFCWNIRSLPRRFDDLQYCLLRMNFTPDIICLSETKITTTVNSEYMPSIENYTFYQKKKLLVRVGV